MLQGLAAQQAPCNCGTLARVRVRAFQSSGRRSRASASSTRIRRGSDARTNRRRRREGVRGSWLRGGSNSSYRGARRSDPRDAALSLRHERAPNISLGSQRCFFRRSARSPGGIRRRARRRHSARSTWSKSAVVVAFGHGTQAATVGGPHAPRINQSAVVDIGAVTRFSDAQR